MCAHTNSLAHVQLHDEHVDYVLLHKYTYTWVHQFLISVGIDIIYCVAWIGNLIVQNSHIRFMDMAKVSHSSTIYSSVNESVGVHMSLFHSPQVKKLLTNLEKL